MKTERRSAGAALPAAAPVDRPLLALQEVIRLAEDDRRRGIRYWFDPGLTVALRDRVRELAGETAAGTRMSSPVRRAAVATRAAPLADGAALPTPDPTSAGSARRQVDSGPGRSRSARPEWGAPPEAAGRAGDWRERLDSLGAEAAACQACRLCQTRHSVVFGTGGGHVPLVFVGEAPGHDEDMQGEPFVGRAGQLLTRIIEAIGLAREQVYICNVLKCRPPENRNPLPDEIASCRRFLERQLEILRPKIICTLGLFAAQLLLGSTLPIGKLRGRLFTDGPWPILPTFHPAYLLRNPSAKATVWEDVQQVRRVLDA